MTLVLMVVSAVGSAATAVGRPVGHQVRYVISTTSDIDANIYYVIADPPERAAANSPQYMPLFRGLVGPRTPWVHETMLVDPGQWAFVSASGGLRVNPNFRCEIAVDGRVVLARQGGSGVECTLRRW
ncbi:hypothetical protein [Mycobacterium novum]